MPSRTADRISVTPPAALREGIRAHAAEIGLSPDTPLARAIIELAEEGYRVRLRRAAEQAMEQVYFAWADDPERAEANAAARAHADEAGLF